MNSFAKLMGCAAALATFVAGTSAQAQDRGKIEQVLVAGTSKGPTWGTGIPGRPGCNGGNNCTGGLGLAFFKPKKEALQVTLYWLPGESGFKAYNVGNTHLEEVASRGGTTSVEVDAGGMIRFSQGSRFSWVCRVSATDTSSFTCNRTAWDGWVYKNLVVRRLPASNSTVNLGEKWF